MKTHTPPIRLLTAVPICDGHDSAISTINLELIRHGIEVVYLGYHRSARDIARAAVQEDVRAVGISSYNGGHVEFFADVRKQLALRGGQDIGLFGGGGGTITRADAALMEKKGVDRIFFAGTSLDEIVAFVKDRYGTPTPRKSDAADKDSAHADRRLGRLLTRATTESSRPRSGRNGSKPHRPHLVVGITGPGGAGKTTLIDELVLRFLQSDPILRIAILSHDPSIVGNGALLGDRAAMFYCQDDRVFMRSLSTAGRAGGLAPETERCLEILEAEPPGGFDVILIETVGIGQEAVPFGGKLVDRTVLVMSPDYGSRVQLQKIAMLDLADVVVVNKSDLASARAASSEISHRVQLNHRDQHVLSTVAKRHRDPGVDELFALLNENHNVGRTPPAAAGAHGTPSRGKPRIESDAPSVPSPGSQGEAPAGSASADAEPSGQRKRTR